MTHGSTNIRLLREFSKTTLLRGPVSHSYCMSWAECENSRAICCHVWCIQRKLQL